MLPLLLLLHIHFPNNLYMFQIKGRFLYGSNIIIFVGFCIGYSISSNPLFLHNFPISSSYYNLFHLLHVLPYLLLLLSWPLVREVCPNYEVLMFQPCTGTSLDLYSVANRYVAILLIPTPPFLSAARCPPEGETRSCPFSLSLSNRLLPT